MTVSGLAICRCAAITLISLLVCGCAESKKPIVTSLSDLRSERRISESDLFRYHEVITLDGSNPTQLVGRPMHYGEPYVGWLTKGIVYVSQAVWPLWPDQDLNPWTAFPIEYISEEGLISEGGPHTVATAKLPEAVQPRNQDTYRRVGWCESPGQKIVRAIAREIDNVQVETIKLVELRLSLAQAVRDGEDKATLTQIRADITTARNAVSEARSKLHDYMVGEDRDGKDTIPEIQEDNYGVLIVRWSTAEEGGLNIDFGEAFGNAGFKGARRKSGYVILGGLEMSQLVVGDDLLRDLAELPKNLKYLKDAYRFELLGITIFTLKAKHISYASDLQFEFAAKLEAKLSKETLAGLTEIDEITIKAELAQAGDLSNIGSLPEMKWAIQPYSLKDRLLKPDPIDGVAVNATALTARDLLAPPSNANPIKGWSTIYSVIAIPKRELQFFVEKDYKKRNEP